MSVYLGDYFSGCTVAGSFTTVTTTGAPTVLTGTAGSVCVVCYKILPADATGLTCSTAGITFAANCLGITGLNTFAVNTNSDPTFYSCGHDFTLLLQGGTVGGTCVSGYTVGLFSLDHRSSLRSIVHGRLVDVDSSGRVLTQPCSTTFTVQKVLDRPIVDACSTIFSVQKLIDRPIVDACSTLFSVQKVVDRPIIDASSVVASVTGAVGSVTGAVGSVGAGGIAAASFAAGAIDAAAIAADAIGSSELAATAAAEIRDAIYDGQPTETYATVTGAPTVAQFLHMIWSAVANFAVAGTLLTTRKIDHCSAAMTFTLNDPTSPTDRTRAT